MQKVLITNFHSKEHAMSVRAWDACVRNRGKSWNVWRWYLGGFSSLVLQDTIKRGNNHSSQKQGSGSTEKSKSWLRISIPSDLGTRAADACCVTSSCCHGFMMFILNDLLKTCSFSSRSLFLVHSKLPVLSETWTCKDCPKGSWFRAAQPFPPSNSV